MNTRCTSTGSPNVMSLPLIVSGTRYRLLVASSQTISCGGSSCISAIQYVAGVLAFSM